MEEQSILGEFREGYVNAVLSLPAFDSRNFLFSKYVTHMTCWTRHLCSSIPSYDNNDVLLVLNIKPKILTLKRDGGNQH